MVGMPYGGGERIAAAPPASGLIIDGMLHEKV